MVADIPENVERWIEWYNAERPHQALGYLSPEQFRAQQATLVA
jgi:putative transposase